MRSRSRLALSIFFASSFLAGALVGCSDDHPLTGGTDVQPVPDASPGDKDAGDAQSPDAASPRKSGTITIHQTTLNGLSASGIEAGFSTSPERPIDYPGCTKLTVDGCEVMQCPWAPSDPGGNPPPDGGSSTDAAADAGAPVIPSAGDITITGPSIPAQGIVLHVAEGHYIDYSGNDTSVFKDGDLLTVEAPGAEVPAFKQTVTAPSVLVLTAPPVDSVAGSLNVTIDQSKDLAVTWSSGGAGDMIASVFTATKNVGSTGIRCAFKASDNKGTIPAAALAKLGKVDGKTTNGGMTLIPQSTKAFAAGEFDVKLVVTSIGSTYQLVAPK
jgi:hypothetical protein